MNASENGQSMLYNISLGRMEKEKSKMYFFFSVRGGGSRFGKRLIVRYFFLCVVNFTWRLMVSFADQWLGRRLQFVDLRIAWCELEP